MNIYWKIYKFGTITNLQRGHNPPKKLFVSSPKEGYVRFYQIRDGWSAKYVVYVPYTPKLHRVRPEDILMVAYRHIGRAFREADGAFNVALCKISNKRKDILDDEFLYHLTQTNFIKGELLNRSERSLIPSMSIEHLRNLEVALPPIPEQKRIVKILDKAFAAIAKAKANAEKNLRNSRELFDSYLNKVFTNPGKDWEEKKLGEVANLSRGHNPPKSQFSKEPQKGYIRFYQIRDGKNDDYAVYVPDSPKLHKVEGDDILMVAYRHIGRAYRGASGAFNVALCKISIKDRTFLNNDFLFYLIPSNFVKGELLKRSERSLIPSMSIYHLQNITIPIPPIGVQNSLVQQIKIITNQTKKLEKIYQQKLADLEELKKSILRKAFDGEL